MPHHVPKHPPEPECGGKNPPPTSEPLLLVSCLTFKDFRFWVPPLVRPSSRHSMNTATSQRRRHRHGTAIIIHSSFPPRARRARFFKSGREVCTVWHQIYNVYLSPCLVGALGVLSVEPTEEGKHTNKILGKLYEFIRL